MASQLAVAHSAIKDPTTQIATLTCLTRSPLDALMFSPSCVLSGLTNFNAWNRHLLDVLGEQAYTFLTTGTPPLEWTSVNTELWDNHCIRIVTTSVDPATISLLFLEIDDHDISAHRYWMLLNTRYASRDIRASIQLARRLANLAAFPASKDNISAWCTNIRALLHDCRTSAINFEQLASACILNALPTSLTDLHSTIDTTHSFSGTVLPAEPILRLIETSDVSCAFTSQPGDSDTFSPTTSP
ncbi:BQ2448_6242 [Microbotryum intermedium]|uniref:BQ2448_6242 protein n=1 Tax=Microbotryum intermedium TaxID=269621 RepID=A0A238FJ55_9BASI|nr:BQ2448_6242 [Microbotryum intermedium]